MKYRIVYGSDFAKAVGKYDPVVRRRLEKSLQLLAANPFHSELHTKPLVGSLKGFYSFRLGRDYRVIFVFLKESLIQLVKLAKRSEIYR